jgi:hypothetical protein
MGRDDLRNDGEGLDDEPRYFQTTHWSLVRRAGAEDDAGPRDALADLVRQYQGPVKFHLVRERRLDPQQAADLWQDFLLKRVLERDFLRSADQHRGKFRTFLLSAVNNFVFTSFRDAGRLKRSPQKGIVGLDQAAEAADTRNDPPSRAFDLEWARAVLEQALDQMREECLGKGQDRVWGVFEGRYVVPIRGGQALSYEQLIEQFGFQSTVQASNALTTAIRKFDRILRAVVGQYAREPGDVDNEIRDLRQILAVPRAESADPSA